VSGKTSVSSLLRDEDAFMTWQKDRPLKSGEIEFHLTGLRLNKGEPIAFAHDDEWRVKRTQKLTSRHAQR